MFLHERIAEYIKENDISQKKLADRTGMSENALSLSLNGKRKLLADEYIGICDAMCVPYNRFTEQRNQAS